MAARLRRLTSTSSNRAKMVTDTPSAAGTPRETDVERWMNRGDVQRLEQLVLDGKFELLEGRFSLHAKTREFLKTVPQYKEKISELFSAIARGDLARVRDAVNYRHVLLAKHPTKAATCLHLAVICQQAEIVRFLLDKAGELANVPDQEKRTPLHYAAILDDGKIFRILTAHDAKTDLKDIEGYTPSYYKANPGLIQADRIRGIYQYTAQKGLTSNPASERESKRQWFRKLEKLVLDGRGFMLDLERQPLPHGFEQEERMLKSLMDGDEKIVKQLLDKDMLFSCRDGEVGLTPLHQAVLSGHENVVRYIALKKPATAYELDMESRTPLHYAALLGRLDLFSLLKDVSNAETTIPDKAGHTADFYIDNPNPDFLKQSTRVTRSNKPSVSFVEEIPVTRTSVSESIATTMSDSPFDSSDTDPTDAEIEHWIQNKDFGKLENAALKGRSSLILGKAREYQEVASFLENVAHNQKKLVEVEDAVKSGNLRKVKSLIDRKKLACAPSKHGRTPLQTAIKFRQKHIVQYLIESFPDCVEAKDKLKRTALHYAAIAATRDRELYNKLIEAGASTEAEDTKGRTAQYYLDHPEVMSEEEESEEEKKVVGIEVPEDDTDQEEIESLKRNNISKKPRRTVTVETAESPQNSPDPENLEEPMIAAYGLETDGPTEEEITELIDEGKLEQLEDLVLSGYGNALKEHVSVNDTVNEFLQAIPQYQAKIDAIHKAVEEGDVRRVKSLIDNPKLALARDKKGATPLHNSVLYGQTDTLRYLVQKFPQAVNATDKMDRTPLHYAAADRNGGHYIKLLQKAGADAFIEDKLGHTPFYYRSNPLQLDLKSLKDEAVMDQLMAGELPRPLLQDLEEDIIEWLQTANLGKLEELVLNGYGDLLLGKVHDVDDPDVLSFLDILPQYQAKIRAIHGAVQLGNIRDVKALIDRKKLALARDNKGATPLHNAVLYDKEDIVKYLLRTYPQAVNAQDHVKRTALHYAAAVQDGGEYYKLLRKAGADPNIQDGQGKSPKYYLNRPDSLDLEQLRMDSRAALRQALQQRVAPSYLEASIQVWVKEGNTAKLEQLVLSGCGDLLQGRTSTNTETEEFLNGLPTYLEKIDRIHHAVREGDVKHLQDSIDKVKLSLARDRKGATPLHDAILYEQTEVVRFLAQTYPQVLNAPDYNKRSALHYAAASRDGGHFYKILERAGADPKLTDNEGHTPEFYLKNPGKLNLKAIRERDLDFVVDVETDYGERNIESPASELSAPTPDSVDGRNEDKILTRKQSLKIGNAEFISVAAAADDSSPVIDTESTRTMRLFDEAYKRKLAEAQQCAADGTKFMPTSETGKYLAKTLGPILTKAIAELLIRRPVDAIGFLSEWLYKYHDDVMRAKQAEETDQQKMETAA